MVLPNKKNSTSKEQFAKGMTTIKDVIAPSYVELDFDSIKIRVTDFASKKEVENLISKFDDFEKYTGNIIKLINNKFEKLQKELNEEFSKKFQETDKLLHGFEILAQKKPDLDKYFDLLEEEAKKVPQDNIKVEKIKEIGEEMKEPKMEESGGVLSKFKGLADKFRRK